MSAMGKRGLVGWVTLGLATLSLALAACNQPVGAERPPVPGDRAVARVNGRTIWASDVKREAVAQGLITDGEPLDISSDIFRQTLDEVVDHRLLAAEALRRHLDRDPVVQRRLAAARERILGDMLVENAVSGAVNENAIRSLYNEQRQLASQSEEFRARRIVVATQAEATQVKALLDAGGAFEALAMDRSIDIPTKYNGGDMGYFTLDIMAEPYQQALRSARPGQLVGPFQSEEGWVILKVEDRRPEQPITLDAARPQIIRFLTYDQVRDLLLRLRANSRVEMLIAPAADVPGRPREPASAPRITAPPASSTGGPQSANAASSDTPAVPTPPADHPAASRPALRGQQSGSAAR